MSPTEMLLEKQVELFSEQLETMKGIKQLMKERNEIEKEKLEFMKMGVKIENEKLMIGQHSLLNYPYVPAFQMNTSVDSDDKK